MSRWLYVAWIAVYCGGSLGGSFLKANEPGPEPIGTVEFQPLASATGRLLEALQFQGTPLPEADTLALQAPKHDPERQPQFLAAQAPS